MSRIVVATAAIAPMVAAIVAWSNFVTVEPNAAAVAKAAAEEGPPIISPLEMMQDYRKMLPIEDWRPAN